mmetsp:Transcript_12974/g.32937  ORF Transcript_12974/g.32937 Transcript_12974/m.32937 type:complete len:216 (+) Transcript_12974:201-848(+)
MNSRRRPMVSRMGRRLAAAASAACTRRPLTGFPSRSCLKVRPSDYCARQHAHALVSAAPPVPTSTLPFPAPPVFAHGPSPGTRPLASTQPLAGTRLLAGTPPLSLHTPPRWHTTDLRHGTLSLAVKRAKSGHSGGLLRKLEGEVRMLKGCNHPHLLPLLGYCLSKDAPCLVSPLMRGGSLGVRLRPAEADPEQLRLLGLPPPLEPLTWTQRVRRD